MHALKRFSWLLLAFAATRASAYDGQALNDQGAVLPGATIRVVQATAPTTLASIFETNGAPKANPFTADAQGRYAFMAAAGDYDITVTASGFSATLVNVPVVDPGAPHVIGGDDGRAPLTLVEASAPATAGNAALVLERRRSDGTSIAGPWSLHVNAGPTSDPARLEWLYNVDWNEPTQRPTNRITADVAFALRSEPISGSANPAQRHFSFAYDYAREGAAGGTPVWTTIFESDEAQFSDIGQQGIIRAGAGPFVISDGLEGSSLVARRVNWSRFDKPAPAGILSPVVRPNPEPQPGDVVVPTATPDYPSAAPATAHAERDATVYLLGGNGTPPSLLTVGKALVRVASGVVAAPGDVVVSSGIESARAAVDNTITDPRRIVGLALEPVGATLPGYVAIVRTTR